MLIESVLGLKYTQETSFSEESNLQNIKKQLSATVDKIGLEIDGASVNDTIADDPRLSIKDHQSISNMEPGRVCQVDNVVVSIKGHAKPSEKIRVIVTE